MKKLKLTGLVSCLLVLSSYAFSNTHQAEELGNFLKEFHANPAEVMQQLPIKSNTGDLFSEEIINSNDFVLVKTKQKELQNICRDIDGVNQCLNDATLEGKAGFQANDRAENLVDSSYNHIQNLSEMENVIENDGYALSGYLDEQPWSDDYWALANGVLGYRYGDSDMRFPNGWKNTHNWHMDKNAMNYVLENRTNILSPSEKYDLLIGDTNFTLTKAMWKEGEHYWSPEKDVETWMGICHGWAIAAYMVPRPTSSIEVTAADGKTKITFYPADIKALASLLWAKKSPSARFVGGRCNEKNPSVDSNGRVQNQKCFDSNPGTWHKVIVNQIKSGGRSFVMDATYDYEVWNQPVLSYNYSYFNPMTGATSTSWKDNNVRIKPAAFTNDKFKSYRSNKATYIVGVQMVVEYMAETKPKQRNYDEEHMDIVHDVTYRYDLEVTENGDIIGGEWYTNAHPDFLWTSEEDARAETSFDVYVEDETITPNHISDAFLKAATYSNGYYSRGPSFEGAPLAKVVEELIRLSNE